MAESLSGQTKNHVCEDCGQAFASLDDLTQHYRQDHPESL